MEEHIVHLRPPLWLPLSVAILIGGFYVAGQFVETRDRDPLVISVSGEGRAFAVPDIAELSFGVQTGRQKTAQIAMEKLQKDMNAIFEAVKAEGIEEKDIRTEALSLNPAYDWTEQGQIPRGFEALQSFRVKIRDLEKVGGVLSAATNAGANQAGGVAFTIDEPDKLRAQARENAIRQGQEKAHLLARQLGGKLGKLKEFSEGGEGFPPPIFARSMMMEKAMGGEVVALPIPAGEQEIVVTITLSYELE